MKLLRSFYERPTLEVSKDLLGKHLIFHSPKGKLVGEISEVEAYLGETDPACHAFVGRTKRTAPLYLEGGYSYVYFIYGMYYCFNVVTEVKDCAGAVLIRSVIPIEGIQQMQENRAGKAKRIADLTNGPGKLCTAFGITLSQNAVDMVNSDALYIEDVGKTVTDYRVTPRIGITKAAEKPWRFVY